MRGRTANRFGMTRDKAGNHKSTAIKTAAVISCTALLIFMLTGSGFLGFSRSLALLSVGIMQPEGGAHALSERLERAPAQGITPQDTTGVQETTGTSAADSSDEASAGTPVTTGPVVPGFAPREYPVPPEDGTGGKVIEEQLSTGSKFVHGVAIKNNSSRTIDIEAQFVTKPELGLTDTDKPQVLIMHTHTTEAYMTYYAGYYNKSDSSRTFDNQLNVMAVGEVVTAKLRESGIGVIHDVTVHDNPQYTGAYDRSAKKVQEILDKYPTIKVVLDLHRDAVNRSETLKSKPTTMVNGEKAAQIMIITSINSLAATPHPDWQHNLRLAVRLQSEINGEYPGLIRPLNLVDIRYNQHLTHGSLLIEMGSEANTINEAIYSAQLFGQSLSKVLKSLM